MRSWTRTLNLDDAHTILHTAAVGLTREEWEEASITAMEEMDREKPLTRARQTDLLRIIRESFLSWEGQGSEAVIVENNFLRLYNHEKASPTAQMELVDIQWALFSEVTRAAIREIIIPHLNAPGEGEIDLATVDQFCAEILETDAPDSIRKTRTVLCRALERAGVMKTSGTGRHRRLWAKKGEPLPLSYAYLLLEGLRESEQDSLSYQECIGGNFAMDFSQCDVGHAFTCMGWILQNGVLSLKDGRVNA